jgi:hypothetical protein
MPRYENPLASPYPTDPAWGATAQSLATAIFGDPEARAQVQYRRAQMERAQAEAERARAAAGLDTEKTVMVRGRNGVIFGNGPDSLSKILTDPVARSAAQANPDDYNQQQANEGSAGGYLRQLIAPRMPQQQPTQNGLADAMGAGAGEIPTTYDPNEQVIQVSHAKAPPPPELPALDENTLRLIGLLGGHMSNENTALTSEYGDARQRRDLNNKVTLENIQSGDRRFGDRLQYNATTRGQNLDYDAKTRGQNLDYKATTRGQDLENGRVKSGERKVTAADTKDLRTELDSQFPAAANLKGNDVNVKTIVLRRASDLLSSGQARSATEAVQRALQDHGVSYDPDRNVVTFRKSVPQPKRTNW